MRLVLLNKQMTGKRALIKELNEMCTSWQLNRLERALVILGDFIGDPEIDKAINEILALEGEPEQ